MTRQQPPTDEYLDLTKDDSVFVKQMAAKINQRLYTDIPNRVNNAVKLKLAGYAAGIILLLLVVGWLGWQVGKKVIF